MEFSVLMSVYGKDDPTAFAAAVRSVSVEQTKQPTQIVVVEDGPVPEEIDAILRRAEEAAPEIEFTVIRKEKNAGLAAALNSGLAACRHAWVARMDSDDLSVADRFEKQSAYVEAHPEIDVLGGAIAEFSSVVGDMQSERRVGLTEEEIRAMAKSRTPMNHVTVFFRTHAVREIGGYCENFGKLEDYKLWVDLLSAGKHFANLADVLVNVRVGNGFIERRSNRREIEDWDMLQTYLVKNGFIRKGTARKNKLYIRAFIYMPGWMKKLAYKTVLRK